MGKVKKELRIPRGLDDDGRVVDPANANKTKKYYCPSCEDILTLRQGKVKRPHFAHRATELCSQETIIHKLAKYLVTQTIRDWLGEKHRSPLINRTCPDCSTNITQELPSKVTGAVTEARLKSGYIADVGILSQGQVVAAIEIKVHHAVDDLKKINIGVPFIELLGESIIESPMEWTPITDHFRPFKCRFCKDALDAFREKIKSISRRSNVPIASSPYRTAWTHCWKCDKEILVFVWPGEMFGQGLPHDATKPSTVMRRYSRMAGTTYWANTCPYCRSLQGSFFLFSEPDSPLFGFHCSGLTENEYYKDMKELAILYIREY